MAQLDRPTFLAGAVGGVAGGTVVLDPVRFAYATAGDQTRTLTGVIPYGAPDWVYLPVEVPDGVNRMSVTYSYDKPVPPPGLAGNALDIGVFDGGGHELGNAAGFRGWSGGFRTGFTLSASDATPGYLSGPVGAGTWHIIVGPYTVVPQGLTWTVGITLGFGPPGQPFVARPAPHRAAGRGRAWCDGTARTPPTPPCTSSASRTCARSPTGLNGASRHSGPPDTVRPGA